MRFICSLSRHQLRGILLAGVDEGSVIAQPVDALHLLAVERERIDGQVLQLPRTITCLNKYIYVCMYVCMYILCLLAFKCCV